MGFSLYYRSTRPVSPAEAQAVERDAEAASEGRTWLSCEPAIFGSVDMDGHLLSDSKPNFEPHPDDVADAELSGLPDGTIMDLIDVLCQLSRDHGIDWQISHDADPEPIGYIRDGICDDIVRTQAELFAELGGLIAGDLEDFADDDRD
ncbi:hypothetical protein SAMN05444166_3397 [Singulisphaera sp. GP187]|uniref:hypothetical protein n=1 Tax=Singulisphaera sp. GP187 TaxID=1882752 RepID=UPI00092B9DB8|nr:hypothetical protein [Singulisphaera sp. GP187]SIO27494.1 hypothetical protein SAMN05444166_3397 [Singulisphaera sp. GP187]